MFMNKKLEKIKYIVKHEGLSSLFIRPYKSGIKWINRMMVLLFSLFPVDKKKIVFESQGDFVESPRVFYEYLDDNNIKDFKLIWLVQNKSNIKKNIKAVSRNEYRINFRASYQIATAGYFIFSHPYWLTRWRKDQRVIYTTHSVAQLKSGGKGGGPRLYSYVLSCGDYSTYVRKTTLNDYNDKHILCIGMPRIDLMFKHKNCVGLLTPQHAEKKLILCMETFRQTKSWDDGGDKDKFCLNIIKNITEMQRLDNYLGENGYYMVVKIHHLQDMSSINKLSLENIIYLTDTDLAKYDIQVDELLENANILLTDYSSVFYDYLLMDRPIGFMIGDIKEYKRGFLMDDPLSEMPGEKIKSYNDLIRFLDCCSNGKDDWTKERSEIRKKVFKYPDDKNCERLLNWLKQHNKRRIKQ